MREAITAGKNAFFSYINGGAGFAPALFALLLLAYLMYIKKRKAPSESVMWLVKLSLFMLAALVLPFACVFIQQLNPTEDATQMFRMFPSAVLIGVAGVTLYDILVADDEQKDRMRLKTAGILLLAGVFFVAEFTVPWRLTADNYHLLSNKEKVSEDLLLVQAEVGEHRVAMPRRLMAQEGEMPSGLTFIDGPGTTVNEGDPVAMAEAAYAGLCDYVILDKTMLSDETIASLDGTMAEYNFSMAKEWSRYICYQAGETWVLTEHSDDSGAQGVFYTLYNTKQGTLVVVDGGNTPNAEHVREVIEEYGGTVDAWFLTHYHEDHIGAFNDIFANPAGIKIKDIYVSAYDGAYDVFLETYKDWDNPDTFAKYMELSANADNIHHPARGDSFTIDGMQIDIFNTYDETLLSLEQHDLPNNCGLVIKMTTGKDSILFMGDMYSPAVGEYLINTYGTALCAEYINACHHGNSIMPTTFYEAVSPKVMFFDGPEWLVTSDDYRAKALMEWCDTKSIEHYDHRTAPNTFYLW